MIFRPVDLILPDAGPLISLAHADRLELLRVFGRPVVVLDVVERECLKRPDSPDHARLRAWFAHGHNQFRRAETPFLTLYEDALARELSGAEPAATRGFGDATLAWFVKNIERVVEPGVVPLILTEDKDFSVEMRGGRAHVLSTRSWLAGLANVGAIPDAASVIAEIGSHGRALSHLATDVAGQAGGAVTDWIGFVRPTSG